MRGLVDVSVKAALATPFFGFIHTIPNICRSTRISPCTYYPGVRDRLNLSMQEFLYLCACLLAPNVYFFKHLSLLNNGYSLEEYTNINVDAYLILPLPFL
ncbi:hypothetical protein HGRIS_005136 [Hohenbuehelia grisea]|uniref:Uncharacterized protein n=1 Tax=Hohenbuehelia grisea TaxID=104357 RepID=A0ABR3JEK0_9AGAR